MGIRRAVGHWFAFGSHADDTDHGLHGQPHFVVDQSAAVFDQLRECPQLGALGFEAAELVTVFEQQLELQLRIAGIVLGAAGGERLTVPGQGQGVDGKEHQTIVPLQGRDDGPFVELQSDGDRLVLEALAQGAGPRLDGLWFVLKHAGFGFVGTGRLQANVVFGIGGWGFEEISNTLVDKNPETQKPSLAIAHVRVWLEGIASQPAAYGQSRITRGDFGDARKGAQTDAIKKALSYFSIGNRAYHGKLNGSPGYLAT